MKQLFFVLLFSIFPFASHAAVVINEIAWMGTAISASDEWIELYNEDNQSVSLDGWVLKTTDGKPEISLTGTIPALGFYLLERTDDTTIPDVAADTIYKGTLSNSGEHLILRNNLEIVVDEADSSSGWVAGNNQTKQTMERTTSGDWQDSQNPGGTPKAENSATDTSEQSPFLPPEQSTETEPLEVIIYSTGIVFSEILPSPEGPDAKEEWIEIFNQNDLEVDLAGWKIKDGVGSVKTYTFPAGTVIAPYGYLVLARPTTKITLNNSGGDTLYLIWPNDEILNSITFDKASLAESYNQTESGWSWSTTLTPGTANTISVPKTKTKQPASNKVAAGEKKTEGEPLLVHEVGTAAIGEKGKLPSRFTGTFAIALAIAIASAVAMLILKKKLQDV